MSILFFLAEVAISQPLGPQKKPETGKVSGKVVRAGGGEGVPGAKVWIAGKVAVANSEGGFSIGPVPEGSRVVSSEAIVKEGGFLGIGGARRHFRGFAEAAVSAGKEIVVNVPVEPMPQDSEAVCRRCHPDRPTREHPVGRCTHPSGKVLKPRIVAQNARYHEANELAKKEKRPSYPPIVLHEHRKEDGSVFHTYDCESCHTAHVSTPQRVFVLAPFEEGNVLCKGCHA